MWKETVRSCIENDSSRKTDEGAGGVCGSIFLDEEMEKRVGEWLGKRWTRLSQQQRHEFRNDKWTTMKCNFDGTSQQPIRAVIGKSSTTSRMLSLGRKSGALRVDKDYVYFEK